MPQPERATESEGTTARRAEATTDAGMIDERAREMPPRAGSRRRARGAGIRGSWNQRPTGDRRERRRFCARATSSACPIVIRPAPGRMSFSKGAMRHQFRPSGAGGFRPPRPFTPPAPADSPAEMAGPVSESPGSEQGNPKSAGAGPTGTAASGSDRIAAGQSSARTPSASATSRAISRGSDAGRRGPAAPGPARTGAASAGRRPRRPRRTAGSRRP